MKIRELLEREKYINDTIDKFAKRTRNIEVQIGWDNPSINISVNDARQIVTCDRCIYHKYGMCKYHGIVNPDDYCSYAVAK